MRAGRCDLLPIAMNVPSRRAYLDFSAPYTAQPFVIASLRVAPFINQLSELGTATIAIVDGYAQGELIQARYPSLKIRPVANAREGLLLVQQGVVAGYVDSLATIAYQLGLRDLADLKVAGMLEFDMELSTATRKDTPLLGIAVAKALAAIGQDEIDRAVSRWLSALYQPPIDRSWILKFALPMLLVLFGLYVWNRQLSHANEALAAARETLARQAIELEQLANTDRLTGLANRRRLEGILDQELQRSRRYGDRVSILMLDLDHFKDINDRLGHPVGDQVLVAVSDLIQSECRLNDTAARWGGEEFLICCPETDATAARSVAERIRQCVESHRFEAIDQLTVSIGIATLTAEDSVETLIARADRALYAAKRQGRNRVVIS